MRPKNTMSLTPELVARCQRLEADHGLDPEWTPLSDDEFEALAARLVAESGSEPLWIFAYGSLIWKPVFAAIEARRGTVFGWHRSFCLEIKNWRGTPSQPGLMLALDRGGQCDGMVYRVPDKERGAFMLAMLKREISASEDVPTVRWVRVETPAGPLRSLVFWAGPTGRGVSRKLSPEKVAWILARACGYVGSGAEYLYNTVSHLEAIGIRDRNLWRLQELVADEIRAMAPAGA